MFCCPFCKSSLNLKIREEDVYGIRTGNLRCKNCNKNYPIIRYIPRFVKKENYASSFGFEWEEYGKLRSDKYNGTNIIRNTILNRTGWDKNHIRGKFLLECGCGAGNDTEILADLGANLISFDYSNSVETCFENNKDCKNLLIIQADIYNIPLKERAFDIVYCHRVIQHTPNPELAFYSITKYVKDNGEIFLHSYGIGFLYQLNYKHILRSITNRINYKIVHDFLTIIGPILYPLVGKVKYSRKIKGLQCTLLRLLPFDNLDSGLKSSRLTKKEKYYYSLLNVFDSLTPRYDNPNPPSKIIKWFKNSGFRKIILRGTNPVIITGLK